MKHRLSWDLIESQWYEAVWGEETPQAYGALAASELGPHNTAEQN
jgi:hypothetical protein